MTELKIQHNLVSHYNSVPADDEWLCEFLDVFTAPLDPAARASAREAIEAPGVREGIRRAAVGHPAFGARVRTPRELAGACSHL